VGVKRSSWQWSVWVKDLIGVGLRENERSKRVWYLIFEDICCKGKEEKRVGANGS
jgi:hypothetical protein